MRGLILALLLCTSSLAHAEAWVSVNKGGGEITLTDRICRHNDKTYNNLREAYSWTRSLVVEGCWHFLDGNVHVIWFEPNGGYDKRIYSPEGFVKKSN